MRNFINRCALKESAKETFYSEENRLMLIFAGLMPILAFSSALMIVYAMSNAIVTLLIAQGLINESFFMSDSIFYLIIIVFSLPSFWGYMNVINKVARGQDFSILDVFTYYRTPKAIIKAILATVIALLPVAVIIVAGFGLFYLNGILSDYLYNIFKYEFISSSIEAFIGVLIVALLILSIIPLMRFYPYVALCADDDFKIFGSVPKAISVSRQRCGDIFSFILSFTGYAAFSAVSIGIVYIIFAKPYMFISYSMMVGEMQRIKEKSKSDKNIIEQIEQTSITEERVITR